MAAAVAPAGGVMAGGRVEVCAADERAGQPGEASGGSGTAHDSGNTLICSGGGESLLKILVIGVAGVGVVGAEQVDP